MFAVNDADALEFTVQGDYDGQEISNVFWYLTEELPGGTTFPVADGSTRAMDALVGLWETAICPRLSTGYVVSQYVLRKAVQPFPGGSVKWTFSDVEARLGIPALDSGDASGTSMASFATVNVWYQATPAGRSGRGRKGFGPLPESDSDSATGKGNLLTDAALAAWQTAVDGYDEKLFTGVASPHFVLVPVVASLKNYAAQSGESLTFRPITGSVVRRALGSQVSRKRKNRSA